MWCVLCRARTHEHKQHTTHKTHTKRTQNTHTHTGNTLQSVSSTTGDVVEFRDLAVHGAIGQFFMAHVLKKFFQYLLYRVHVLGH